MNIFSKIHEALGFNKAIPNPVGIGVSAAPLSVQTFMYFQSLGIILHEFYGCTECCGPQTTNMPSKPSFNKSLKQA